MTAVIMKIEAALTDHPGGGKIFSCNVRSVILIRTGGTGADAVN
ncbi:MAG: hypothetical protein LBT22_07600 [Peptococcaceae bacterium]|nr:hypothetical protein [Peptococcaceae bacterium]